MRYRFRPQPIALALSLGCSTALVACAGTNWNGPQSLQGTAQSALPGRGNVFAEQRPDGVVVLRGWVEDEIGRMAVLRDVGRRPDVSDVIDQLRVGLDPY